ncbi:ABC-three component system middle component 1 [Paenibacillus cucumis (ex Kampfer et al. 2016)]|uniref:Uncharacterized protein n=1 Tax=Paenibacillus cucumis (ex Kampfer et al. 2016) TaxID=1776858 RepID=A0ABS7KF16_9BACL|nr:ABC-three component system middle component 1 [Paenibacillus cucumis (ex Kampfer et al. 2016)]MBY0202732.1 hypothetical protein [Paenibacillus cucumis (ex Kampfer et al. 2016)]
MKQIIEKIFYEKGFKIDNELLLNNNVFFAERTANNKFDFFVVLFKKTEEITEDLDDEFSNYLNLIVQRRQNYIGLDKNLSLIIFIECNSLEEHKKIDSIIFDIEEDPYDFKKYVLVHSLDEVKELSENLSDNELKVTDYIEQKLVDSELFSDFKKGKKNGVITEYELITKLYIKLPFLNLRNLSRDTLDLSALIKTEIKEEDYNIWIELLNLSSLSNQLEDDIQKMEFFVNSLEEEDVE